MKKLMMLMMLLLLCLGAAMAEEAAPPTEYTAGDWCYILLEDGTAEITDYTATSYNRPSTLRIPATLGGVPVTSIGEDALYNKTVRVTSVIIPEGVVHIGESAFSNGKFSQLTLPSTLRVIDECAFFYCYNLTSVILPDGLEVLGNRAFDSCTNLVSINLPLSIVTIGDNPFSECPKLNATSVSMSPEHPTLAFIDDVLYSKADKRLVWYPCGKNGSPFVIPRGIRIIGARAFSYARNLSGVEIPDTVTTLGDQAFLGCSMLMEITLPDNLITVGVNPFERSTSIHTVHVSPTHPTLECIEGVLYDKVEKRLIGCYGLTSETCIVPEGTLTIGNFAFRNCNGLRYITIPESVTTIHQYSFLNVTNLLATVPYGSYAEAWCQENGISINHPDALDWLTE